MKNDITEEQTQSMKMIKTEVIFIADKMDEMQKMLIEQK